ncbi:MAG: toast rack family protein [Coriobacteriia bacterium]
MKTTKMLAALALGAVLIAGTGCVRVELQDSDSELLSSSESVELQGAERVEATIKMDVGVLKVSGGAGDLMGAEFDYTRSAWEPDVDYTVAGETGRLEVTQPDFTGPSFGSTYRNDWDITLSNDVPLDLAIELGAGEGKLYLGDLDLEDLRVEMSVGDTMIDLVGDMGHDLDATIEGGVGELTLRLPAGVGVRLVGFRDGVGNYSAPGFEMDGDALVNDEWETASVKYDIVLRRGVGDVNVETVD